MEIRRDVFQAIADPTRRDIIKLLAGKPLNLNAIAGNFDQSRPTISQHIKILSECGLISIKKQGRERYCEAKMEQLDEVSDWISDSKKIWAQRFKKLEKLVIDIEKENIAKRKQKKYGRKKQ
ncbi:MAG: winged helix-turn-helix transcriptional regulator [Bacteroidetes bacterium]|nr:winged helix-turn-helix transcriptional regulator [Bacteroidota bacterium]